MAEHEKRRALLAEPHQCPNCLEPNPIPLGGNGSCWWECRCGAYSPLRLSWEVATKATPWLLVDPDVNARMYPSVGCP